MKKRYSKEYYNFVGFGMILGVAIGTSFEIIFGGDMMINSAVGAGLGIVFGAVVGKVYLKKKID